jgi:NAD(P)-dependent dehydrogenase (short-subunit alcohol dehydrogenase family)
MVDVVIIGASSDIGSALAERYLRRGDRVWGTFRSETATTERLRAAGATLVAADISAPEAIKEFADRLRVEGIGWHRLISAVGLLAPIGPFFETDFEEWERSVQVNSTAQLRALHALRPLQSKEEPARCILFAGGGTNGPFDSYSAYCLGKLMLIKACELLHSECPDLVISILGTGWVATRIHEQTLSAGAAAGPNLERTKNFLADAGAMGTPIETVADCIDWCFAAPRAAVGGRNFSIVHDGWREEGFIEALMAYPDDGKLRRLWHLASFSDSSGSAR